ncbi:MAG: hypothetical protein ABIJ50_05695 [Pseudomonadota bacterium]
MPRLCVFTRLNSDEEFKVVAAKNSDVHPEELESSSLVDLRIQVPQDLYNAYQRCSWIIVHESGRTPLEVMQEMVRDFLVKHGC